MDSDRASRGAGRDLLIHATNAWNPTGHNLQPVSGTRLFYAHIVGLNGQRTLVLLGSQQHLTFIGDFESHIAPDSLRQLTLERSGLYPHQVDLEPAPGRPRVADTRPT